MVLAETFAFSHVDLRGLEQLLCLLPHFTRPTQVCVRVYLG